jgi:hypothetical protein
MLIHAFGNAKSGAFLQIGLNVTSRKAEQSSPTGELIQHLKEKVLEGNRNCELCVNENSPQSVEVFESCLPFTFVVSIRSESHAIIRPPLLLVVCSSGTH